MHEHALKPLPAAILAACLALSAPVDAARVIQIENKLDALATAVLSDQIPLILPR